MTFEDYRIQNRHLSENQVREQFCHRTGEDPHDLDQHLWEERERRNEYYRDVDGY